MEVRRAEPADAAAVAEVFIASFGSLEFLPVLHNDDDHRAFVRDLIGRAEVWVAALDGEIVGMAALSGDVLGQLYVAPGFQSRGVGSALLEQAKRARPDGFTFWVFQENERARGFYERRACRLVRVTDGSGNEERRPDALYAWRPGQPTADSV